MNNDSGHELVLGDLDLIGEMPQGNFTISALGDDATWGNPQPVTRALEGLLQDGARISLDRWENREVFLRVVIEAPTGDGLADGEAALFAELAKRNTLSWTPPGGFASTTVFDVEWSDLDEEFDDFEETLGQRTYALRLTCLPFSRSVEPVVSEVMAPPAPVEEPVDPIIMSVDDCTSTALWSGLSKTTSGGVLDQTLSASNGIYNANYAPANTRVVLTRTASVPTADTPYLVVQWIHQHSDWTNVQSPPGLGAGGGGRMAISTRRLPDGWNETVYHVPTPMVPDLEFTSRLATKPHRLYVRSINRTDQIPSTGNPGHQIARTVIVEGTAPSQASLHVWNATANLGEVLIHTGPTPDGMISLDPYCTNNSGPAGGTVSGRVKTLGSSVSYRIPAGTFDPDRATGYMLMARMQRESTGDVYAYLRSHVAVEGGGTEQVGESQMRRTTVAASTRQRFVCLGVFAVPPHRVTGAGAQVEVSIIATAAVSTDFLDDAWLVDIETGSLTWVDGNQLDRHLWIDPPTRDSPLPRVRTAGDDTGLRGHDVTPSSMGRHAFPPGLVYVYTVATTPQSQAQLEYFPRWRTYARR